MGQKFAFFVHVATGSACPIDRSIDVGDFDIFQLADGRLNDFDTSVSAMTLGCPGALRTAKRIAASRSISKTG